VPKINVDNIHANFVRQLESWVDGLPEHAKDAPFVTAAAKGGKELSPSQVLVHVRKLTPLGVQLTEQAAALAMSDTFREALPGAATKPPVKPARRSRKSATKPRRRGPQNRGGTVTV